MADIFLSHRSEDGGWAGRLFDALQNELSVFLSSEIEKGDNWQQRLDEELQDCRIFVAIIGPGWIAPDNLRALAAPGPGGGSEDWVRRELLTAHVREKDCHFYSLLVGDAKMPTSEALPAELAWVPAIQAQVIAPNEWRAGSAQLAKALKALLAGRRIRSRAREFPRVLPYLCDRVDQEDSLKEGFTGPTTAPALSACVVPGQPLEGHDAFLERLVYTRLLERLLRADSRGLAVHHLDWTISLAQKGLDPLLRKAIRRNVMNDLNASNADLAAFLRDPGCARVLVIQVMWEDQQELGGALLSGLLAAWFALFEQPPRQPLVLWVNLVWPADQAQLPAVGREIVLPPLPSIGAGDIRNWLKLPEVRKYLGDQEALILALPGDKRWSSSKGRLPMITFAEAIQSVANG